MVAAKPSASKLTITPDLDAPRAEFDVMLEKMQTPRERRGGQHSKARRRSARSTSGDFSQDGGKAAELPVFL